MKIVRAGKAYELTKDELYEAHKEFVTSWMAKTLEEDFGVPEDESWDYAELAYQRYTYGDGETEYECIEKIYEEEYLNDHKDGN